MGIVYLKEKEKKIYEMFGISVYGKVDRYTWSIYPDKPDEDCLTQIRFEQNGNDIYSTYLGNNCIFMENFNRTIDNFLWWIVNDMPDGYYIEKQVFKSLTAADSLFNHKIGLRRKNEAKKKAEEERVANLQSEWERKVTFMENVCSKCGWLLYTNKIWESCTIFKTKTDIGRHFLDELIYDDDKKRIDGIVDFINKNPQNPDAELIMVGTIDEAIERFK